MSNQKTYKVKRRCEWCGEEFETKKRGKNTARFCSQSCAAYHINSRPEVKEKISEALSKPPVIKTCEWCREEFEVHPPSVAPERRFCGNSCAAKWRISQPEIREQIYTEERNRKVSEALKEAHRENPDWAAEASERMTRLNQDPEFRRKAIEATKERHRQNPSFLKRGGKPKITEPQQALCEALGFPAEWMEYTVSTGPVKKTLEATGEATGEDLLKSLPHYYALDIAHPPTKTAIEVDGNTHRSKKWKWIDARKERVLNALGWSVLRFWNEEVTEELDRVTFEINSSITSKSQNTTTTSPTAS